MRKSVKTEMERWTHIVKKISKAAVEPIQNVEDAVNSALQDNERNKN